MMTDSFMQFVASEWPVLLTKLWEQLYLVCIATSLAVMIGLPLGIIVRRLHKMKILVLGLASAVWTVPSLALLALFIPVLGIGVKPAILVLSIYGVLPVLRNTVAGLENVSPDSIEAARGLGFTRWQRLTMVELPLACPVIIAGIRTSVSISIGVATLASFVGAGGLGDFINQGLALNNANLILLGAVPAAAMALGFDYLIALIESRMAVSQIRRKKLVWFAVFMMSAAALIALGVMYAAHDLFSENRQSIRIASKNFTEQIVLGELMSQMIEARTRLRVERRFNLGTTAICHAAILSNEIDLYPEYTGTAYLTVLKLHHPPDARNLYAQVRREYKKQFDLDWLAPFGFNNTQALAVKSAFARQYHLRDISDLLLIEDRLIIGVPAEFMQREDALIGLEKTYHLNFGQIRQMDAGLMYDAIKNGQVNLINAFSTDGRIPAYDLVLLNDDKKFYPDYSAAPVIRSQVLKLHPEVEWALKPLLGSLSGQAMRELNYQVDVMHRAPYTAAHDYLRAHKFIP
ncbi:Choline-binding protein [Aquicella siphonis]|uniref:Choline-binding protein n=1 Tax=Aquicella siphonis TaxID=254247 RepID=A0A5E4PGL0_9COXI|nr:glycine betaine ABC transporter substrate-binding protein [Aquicella siphonis]VVC75597.1 Choline-binding protein [Aquicella siphonis]